MVRLDSPKPVYLRQIDNMFYTYILVSSYKNKTYEGGYKNITVEKLFFLGGISLGRFYTMRFLKHNLKLLKEKSILSQRQVAVG